MVSLEDLMEKNREWAASITATDPDFFIRLSKQQSPDILWIGCSDSRVPANQIVNLPPGEVFVHRNIANNVVHSDLNCLSVLQFAIEVLEVKYIIVCGHYGCGGVKAGMEDTDHGLIDNWLRNIREFADRHKDDLAGLDEHESFDRLCELNVIEQARNVSNTTVVKSARKRGADFSIHGWIYNIENGILKDLKIGEGDL